jgi:hypothetical protein
VCVSPASHIDSLFTENVDWNLIETHLPDMLRVVLSIKAGRISASTVLRRLGTYSRKNRLCQAFCELGRVVRPALLQVFGGRVKIGWTRAELVMSEFKWRHFDGEIILWAVRWYSRYGISYRDLEQRMGSQPDRLKASRCRSRLCSPVDTRI